MRTILIFAVGIFLIGSVQAQVGSSISSDGTAPNTNAMLDVKSPATGDGKGMLIPRVTENQRTNANASLDGGLLNDSGNLRGGAAQGLIVYQTDGSQGLYFNTSQAVAPAWIYLGTSTTNYLPLTGGTMSGPINMSGQVVSNVAHLDFNGTAVSVGRGASGSSDGAAVGYQANGNTESAAMGSGANGASEGAAMGFGANGNSSGAAFGWNANGYKNGAVMGWSASGTNYGAALGWQANGSFSGAVVGCQANGYLTGAAVGSGANGYSSGAAVGYEANGYDGGSSMGREANGSSVGAAIGRQANGNYYGAVVGAFANGYDNGAAVGRQTDGSDHGVAIGDMANGVYYGAAVGWSANGYFYGTALGRQAKGTNLGVAVGYQANGARTNVAIGVQANAQGGTERIAIGHNVTNAVDNSAAVRGHLYLDGGTGVWYRSTFGSGGWTAKAFEIDHPLDPENKILRHFCLEGPQVWNVYAGNVQLVNGQATVQLPDYYSALNLAGSEIYSLTPISSDLQIAVIKQEVINNRFVIGGSSDMKVSWTIKVLRNDPGCREDLRRRPVEQMKEEILNSRTAE